MMRTLVVAGATALALLLPTLTFAAPTGAVRAVSAPALPPPRVLETRRGTEATEDSFKVPMHINVRPGASEPNWESLHPYRWHPSQANPAYFWSQPAWLQDGCYANGPLGFPPGAASAPASAQNETLGSLVDGRSKNLFSATPSYNPSSPLSGDALAASNAPGLQIQVQPTACGSNRVLGL
jgi:hypothetical protein